MSVGLAKKSAAKSNEWLVNQKYAAVFDFRAKTAKFSAIAGSRSLVNTTRQGKGEEIF